MKGSDMGLTGAEQDAFVAWWQSGGVLAFPVGGIVLFVGAVAPLNTLFCRGQYVAIAAYPECAAECGTRFGPLVGDTFPLPDFRGMIPVGYNTDPGRFSGGVGERAGSYDAVVVDHDHDGADHGHDNSHDHPPVGPHGHNVAGTQQMDYSGPGSEFDVRVGDGITIPMDRVTAVGESVDVAPWSGTTGLADRALTTGRRGVSGVNANIQPSLSVNYVIRVR